MSDHIPESLYDWFCSKCGLVANPSWLTSPESQPKLFVVDECGHPIAAAADVRSGFEAISEHVERRLRYSTEEEFLEVIDD